MTRAFVAIVPPEPVLDAIAACVARMQVPGGRPTPREQWHLTLQFLGNDVDLDAVAAAFVRDPLDAGPCALRLGGAVSFGNVRRGRVIALGVQEGGVWIAGLAAQVGARLAPLGLGLGDRLGHSPSRDDREMDRTYVPHLTLCRFREPTDVGPARATIGAAPVGPAWRVKSVVLFESRLSSNGARHFTRATISTGSDALNA